MVNTAACYVEGPGFKSRQGRMMRSLSQLTMWLSLKFSRLNNGKNTLGLCWKLQIFYSFSLPSLFPFHHFLSLCFFLSWKNGTIKCVDGARSLWSKTFFFNFHTKKLAHFRWDPEHAEVKKCTRSIWTQKYGYLEGCTLYTWVKNFGIWVNSWNS